jgi:BirA family biotin operon repressor/biotin-[acetyl-CoA-carboxylase] ligase
MQLDPLAVDAGVRVAALATVGSTNSEARSRAQRGERGPLWITAATQTAGRGRMDRSWVSPQGNLYASLLLSDPSSFERAPELAFVAALALRDAVAAESPWLAPQLTFKWPNDLLLAGEKCAGVLIEGDIDANKTAVVVIGIGVNCANHPADTAFPATDLHAHGAELTPQQLFRQLSVTMCLRLRQWNRGQNFPAILGDWRAAASGIGEEITVRNGGGEKRGRFAGLDQSGRLMLGLPGGGVEKIAAGDVFPLSFHGSPRAQSGPS